ncbi:MAG: methyltransferase, partial [Myxococcota bacterium]
ERVIAVDRAEAQLEQARRRAEDRGFGNVHFFHGELAGEALTQLVAELNPDRWGADAVVAARVLHHAPVPAQAVKSLAALAAPREANYPGGAVLVLDYEPHDDAPLRERQADLWPGFEREELEQWAAQAGLTDIEAGSLPMRGNGTRTDRSLQWQWLSARRGKQRE